MEATPPLPRKLALACHVRARNILRKCEWNFDDTWQIRYNPKNPITDPASSG